MKKCLSALLLWLVALFANAATLVDSYSGESFGDPINVAINAVGSGNTLFVVFKHPTASVSVSDNGGASPVYTPDYSATTYSGSGESFYFFRRTNITDAPTQVSINLPAGALISYAVFEVSGVTNTSPLGQTNVSAASTASPSVGVTTATANECGVGAYSASAGSTVTAGGTATWTEYSPGADPVFDTYFFNPDLGGAGAKTLAPTLSGSTNNAVAIATYLNAGGGSSSGLLLRRRRS